MNATTTIGFWVAALLAAHLLDRARCYNSPCATIVRICGKMDGELRRMQRTLGKRQRERRSALADAKKILERARNG